MHNIILLFLAGLAVSAALVGAESAHSQSDTNGTTPNSVSFDRTIYPVPWGEGQFPLYSGDDYLPAGDLTVHVRIYDPDFDVSASGEDSISVDGEAPVTITVSRGSNSTVVATAGNTANPINKIAPDAGIFELDATISYDAGPNNGCPEFFSDGCILQGDIITVEYADPTDASGSVNTVTDSATFDLRNGVLQTDKSVYIIGSDMILTLIEPDFDLDNDGAETYTLDLINWDSGAFSGTMGSAGAQAAAFDPEPFALRETGNSTGIFQSVIKIPRELDGEALDRGEEIELEYTDWGPAGANYVGDEDEDINLTVFTSNFGATIELDRKVYTWTDKVYITIVAPDHNFDSELVDEIGTGDSDDPLRIATSESELIDYRLVETGTDTGVFSGEVILTGFRPHDADGDGDADDAPGVTSGVGPTDGLLRADDEDGISVSFEFSEDETVVGSALIRWNIGQVEWLETLYPAAGNGTVRVTDPDMNLNPEVPDSFEIGVSSDTDPEGIRLIVTETGAATGVFEGTVCLVTASSSGSRLQVLQADTVTAKYDNQTLPDPYSRSGDITTSAATMVTGTATLDPCNPTRHVLGLGTDASTYHSGDTIRIVGNVGDVNALTDITIIVSNPAQNIAAVEQITPASDGSYTAEFLTLGSLWASAGHYTIDAKYGDDRDFATFSFSGSHTAPPPPASGHVPVEPEPVPVEPEPVPVEPEPEPPAEPPTVRAVMAPVSDTAFGRVLEAYMSRGLVAFTGVLLGSGDTSYMISKDITHTVSEDGAVSIGVVRPASPNMAPSLVGDHITRSQISAGFLYTGIVINATDTGGPGAGTVSYTLSDDAGQNGNATLSVLIHEIGNVPPVLSPVGDYSINARETLTFQASAVDFGGDMITYRLSGAPAGAEISREGEFSWTPGSTDVANHTFTIIAYDVHGAADTESVTITVLPAGTTNQPPTAPNATATVDRGGLVTIMPAITDPDGDRVSIVDVGGGAGGSAISSADSIEYLATTNAAVETVTYTVKDSRGACYTGTITVDIQGAQIPGLADAPVQANAAPLLGDILGMNITVRDTLEFTAMACDRDGDTLTYSLAGHPVGATINSTNGEFVWRPVASQAGTHIFTMTVTDEHGGTDYQIIKVRVLPGRTVSMPMGSGLSSSCAAANRCFVPHEVTINIGDQITWTNDDQVIHTVKVGRPDSSRPEGSDSGFMTSGDVFSKTFTTPGTYDYTCILHPWMMGTVHVLPSTPSANVSITAEAVNVSCKDRDTCLDQSTATIDVGGEVTWTNNAGSLVSLISGTPADADAGSMFQSGPIWDGATYTHTFEEAGRHHYFSAIQPWVTGTVIVTD